MGKIEREIFESFDRETRRLLNENSNGKNNEVLRERMKTRAIMTYSHNLAMYYEQSPFGTELFYIDAWIDENKNWLESSKIFIYYGASEVRSNKDYSLFTIKVNGEQKIVGRVEDYYVTHSRDDDENSLMRRKNYFQQLAYVQYLEERRIELTQPQIPEPKPFDLLNTSTVEKSQKPKPQGKTLKQFFIEEIDPEIISTLQIKYKDLYGKNMAYLIYLLHKEFNLINYSLRGRKDSRKRFVNEFTGKNINNIEGINKIFNSNDITIGIDKYHKDNDYITIQNEIQTILNPIK